jgi:hypothetical protein
VRTTGGDFAGSGARRIVQDKNIAVELAVERVDPI